MKATSIFLLTYLVLIGLFACLYGLTGVDLLALLCFQNPIVYRLLLSFSGVAALWLVFWAIFFRPFRPLS